MRVQKKLKEIALTCFILVLVILTFSNLLWAQSKTSKVKQPAKATGRKVKPEEAELSAEDIKVKEQMEKWQRVGYIANLLMSAGRYDQAMALHEKTVEESSDSQEVVTALEEIARIYEMQYKYDEAIRTYRDIIKKRENAYSKFQEKLKKAEDALKEVKEFLRKDTAKPEALPAGIAIPELQREVWAYQAGVANAKFAIASIYEKQGQPTQALKVLQEIAEKGKNLVTVRQARFAIGNLHKSQNHLDKALKIYQELLEEIVGVGKGMGQPFYTTGRPRFFGGPMPQHSRPLFATESSVRIAIAEIYEAQKEYDKTIESYQKALEKEPEGEQALLVLYLMANAFEKQEKYDQAIETFGKIIAKEAANLEEIRKHFETRFKGKEQPPLPESTMTVVAQDEIVRLRKKRKR